MHYILKSILLNQNKNALTSKGAENANLQFPLFPEMGLLFCLTWDSESQIQVLTRHNLTHQRFLL